MKGLYHKYKEVIRYILVGGLTTLISLVIYYGCVVTFLNPKVPLELQTANILSWIGAVLFSYVCNRKYVFESDSKEVLKELVAFFVARFTTLVIDMMSMFFMVTVSSVNDKVAKLIVQVIVIVANYFFSKFFVFRKIKHSEK